MNDLKEFLYYSSNQDPIQNPVLVDDNSGEQFANLFFENPLISNFGTPQNKSALSSMMNDIFYTKAFLLEELKTKKNPKEDQKSVIDFASAIVCLEAASYLAMLGTQLVNIIIQELQQNMDVGQSDFNFFARSLLEIPAYLKFFDLKIKDHPQLGLGEISQSMPVLQTIVVDLITNFGPLFNTGPQAIEVFSQKAGQLPGFLQQVIQMCTDYSNKLTQQFQQFTSKKNDRKQMAILIQETSSAFIDVGKLTLDMMFTDYNSIPNLSAFYHAGVLFNYAKSVGMLYKGYAGRESAENISNNFTQSYQAFNQQISQSFAPFISALSQTQTNIFRQGIATPLVSKLNVVLQFLQKASAGILQKALGTITQIEIVVEYEEEDDEEEEEEEEDYPEVDKIESTMFQKNDICNLFFPLIEVTSAFCTEIYNKGNWQSQLDPFQKEYQKMKTKMHEAIKTLSQQEKKAKTQAEKDQITEEKKQILLSITAADTSIPELFTKIQLFAQYQTSDYIRLSCTVSFLNFLSQLIVACPKDARIIHKLKSLIDLSLEILSKIFGLNAEIQALSTPFMQKCQSLPQQQTPLVAVPFFAHFSCLQTIVNLQQITQNYKDMDDTKDIESLLQISDQVTPLFECIYASFCETNFKDLGFTNEYLIITEYYYILPTLTKSLRRFTLSFIYSTLQVVLSTCESAILQLTPCCKNTGKEIDTIVSQYNKISNSSTDKLITLRNQILFNYCLDMQNGLNSDQIKFDFSGISKFIKKIEQKLIEVSSIYYDDILSSHQQSLLLTSSLIEYCSQISSFCLKLENVGKSTKTLLNIEYVFPFFTYSAIMISTKLSQQNTEFSQKIMELITYLFGIASFSRLYPGLEQVYQLIQQESLILLQLDTDILLNPSNDKTQEIQAHISNIFSALNQAVIPFSDQGKKTKLQTQLQLQNIQPPSNKIKSYQITFVTFKLVNESDSEDSSDEEKEETKKKASEPSKKKKKQDDSKKKQKEMEERKKKEEEERQRKEEEEEQKRKAEEEARLKREAEEERLRKEEEERKQREEEERRQREEEERRQREEEERRQREEEERRRKEEEERKRKEEEERLRREDEERKRKEEEERLRKEQEEKERKEEEERRRKMEEILRKQKEEQDLISRQQAEQNAVLDNYELLMRSLQQPNPNAKQGRPEFVNEIRRYVDTLKQLIERLKQNPTNSQIPQSIRTITTSLQGCISNAENYFQR